MQISDLNLVPSILTEEASPGDTLTQLQTRDQKTAIPNFQLYAYP